MIFAPRADEVVVAALTITSDDVYRPEIALSLIGIVGQTGFNEEVTLELIDGIPMDFVWINPGTLDG